MCGSFAFLCLAAIVVTLATTTNAKGSLKISLSTCLQLSSPQKEPCGKDTPRAGCILRHDGFPVLITDGCPLVTYRCTHLGYGWRALLAMKEVEMQECCGTKLYENNPACFKPARKSSRKHLKIN